jgi:hypothetical protein
MMTFVEQSRTEVPVGLPMRLVVTLASLHDAPAGMAELAVASLGYGSRCALAAYGLIEPVPPRPDEPAEIVITEAGRRVIDACAAQQPLSDEHLQQSTRALDRARDRYEAQRRRSAD